MTEPWRFRCPNGHTSFQFRPGNPNHGVDAKTRYYCPVCRDTGRSPHHEFVIDAKTGEQVTKAVSR